MPNRTLGLDRAPVRASNVAGAVLAAGSSSRMGSNKLLIEWDGLSLLARAVRSATSAGLDPLVVVVGFEAERVTEALAGEPCRIVPNLAHELGMYSSAAAAAGAVAEEADALVFILADMPLVTAGMMKKVKERYLRDRPRLVVSRYGEVIAPPTLFASSLFPHLLAKRGGNVRGLVEEFRPEAAVIDWPPHLLRDIDTPEDLVALRADVK